MPNGKQVADPIHGSISLSALETKIIGSGAFLRLQNVKHLGLAHLVHPGADFSRFSHCLGVCHVAGRLLRRLGCDPESKEFHEYRLAALLHDVGHYPLSHATERAVDNHYKKSLLKSGPVATSSGGPEHIAAYNHVRVGKEVVCHDPEISTLIRKAGFVPEEIASLFLHERPGPYANLISSELDADRLDYLLRMSYGTGLPYGKVDLDYIIAGMSLDGERLCVTEKTARTVEHFLLCRYFAYQQIALQKTVVALERVLEDVVGALLEKGLIDCSPSAVTQMVGDGERWHEFDDSMLIRECRNLRRSTTDEVLLTQLTSILDRKPPKLIREIQIIGRRDDPNHFASMQTVARHFMEDWSEKLDIPPALWVAKPYKASITSVGALVPVDAFPSDEDIGQSVMVKMPNGNLEPIANRKSSLLSVLANYTLFSFRLFVLLPQSWDETRKNKAYVELKASAMEEIQ